MLSRDDGQVYPICSEVKDFQSRSRQIWNWVDIKPFVYTHLLWEKSVGKERIFLSKYELQHEKTNNVDSDQVWHKPDCAATWDG